MQNSAAARSPLRTVRYPELLGLRGLLAVGVVLCHADIRPIFWLISAMDCFFVLSAFLITMSLLHSTGPTIGSKLKHFYVRRVARIFPGYYGLLLGIALLIVLIDALSSKLSLHPYSLRELVPYVFYLQYTDLFGTTNELTIWDNSLRFIMHTWSLAVEEQFYLLWGFLFFAAYRPWMKAVVAVAFIVIGIASRVSGLVVSPLIPYRLDAFGYGIALALFYYYVAAKGSPERFKSYSRTAALAAFIALLIFLQGSGIPDIYYRWIALGEPIEYFQWTPMSVMSCFGLGALITALVFGTGSRWSAFLRRPVPLYLGQISYALYLVHYPILDILLYINTRLLPIGRYGNIAVGMCLAIGIAHVATKYLNKAQRQIIDWADPDPTPPATAVILREATR